MSAWSELDAFKRRVSDAASEISGAELASAVDERGGVRNDVSPELSAKLKGLLIPNKLKVMGWLVMLTCDKLDGNLHWHMSASLTPKGRSSTQHDWQKLGQISARLRAPRDPIAVPNDPNAPLHWQWVENACDPLHRLECV